MGFFLCNPLANLGFAHEDIRIMTDERHPWNPPTKENIVSHPICDVASALKFHLVARDEVTCS